MNEETEETICGELAIATGYYVIEIQHDGLGWQVVHNSGVFPFATRERCEEFVLKTAPGYLTDWNATGALIEWWLKDEGEEISCLYWSIRFRFHVAAICSGTGENLQTAIVHAIYAGLKEKESENEEK